MTTINTPRFQGNATLLACHQGTHVMQVGEPDAMATKAIQLALVDLGYLPDYREVDGKYGARTEAAVSRYKSDRSISLSDGKVGLKTMTALDAEFPVFAVLPGSFAPFILTGQIDGRIASLLSELEGVSGGSWANDSAALAMAALSDTRLWGITSQANSPLVKALIPAAHQHIVEDASAAAGTNYAATACYFDGALVRGVIIVADNLLKECAPGEQHHFLTRITLAHEIAHFRNHAVMEAIQAEPISATAYVDVADAMFREDDPANFTRTTRTRRAYIDELAARHLAWRARKDILRAETLARIAAGLIPSTALSNLEPPPPSLGQFFKACIDFADWGRSSVVGGSVFADNGYVDVLGPADLSKQVGMWMSDLSRVVFHSIPAQDSQVQGMLARDLAAFSPTFAHPGVTPTGLAHGKHS